MAARRSNALTLGIAALMACALWTYVTLTRTYEDDVQVPIVVSPPAGQTIISSVPTAMMVRVRTSGLRLASFQLLKHPDTCHLTLEQQSPSDPSVFSVTNTALMRELSVALGVRVMGVSPTDVMVRTGIPVIKSVPLNVAHTINCRQGFIMTSPPVADRANVALKGIGDVITPLTQWSTKRIMLDDVHENMSIDVPVNDSLASMVDVTPHTVRVHIKVQQVAEAQIRDVPVTLSKQLIEAGYEARPQRITVTLRGGVEDLASTTSMNVRAEIKEHRPYGTCVPIVSAPSAMCVIATHPRTVQLVRRQPL